MIYFFILQIAGWIAFLSIPIENFILETKTERILFGIIMISLPCLFFILSIIVKTIVTIEESKK